MTRGYVSQWQGLVVLRVHESGIGSRIARVSL
jgi:hypothetical protein